LKDKKKGTIGVQKFFQKKKRGCGPKQMREKDKTGQVAQGQSGLKRGVNKKKTKDVGKVEKRYAGSTKDHLQPSAGAGKGLGKPTGKNNKRFLEQAKDLRKKGKTKGGGGKIKTSPQLED